MRLLYLLVWDAMFCIVLSISHFASATLISPDSSYIVTLITFAVCGAFLGHLPHVDGLTIVFVTLPALYLALAPFLAPILNTLPLPLPGGISLVRPHCCPRIPCCCAMPAHSQPDTRCGESFNSKHSLYQPKFS